MTNLDFPALLKKSSTSSLTVMTLIGKLARISVEVYNSGKGFLSDQEASRRLRKIDWMALKNLQPTLVFIAGSAH